MRMVNSQKQKCSSTSTRRGSRMHKVRRAHTAHGTRHTAHALRHKVEKDMRGKVGLAEDVLQHRKLGWEALGLDVSRTKVSVRRRLGCGVCGVRHTCVALRCT
jgi:positive regulator of sigma E activity